MELMPFDDLKVPWRVLQALTCRTVITHWKIWCLVTKHREKVPHSYRHQHVRSINLVSECKIMFLYQCSFTAKTAHSDAIHDLLFYSLWCPKRSLDGMGGKKHFVTVLSTPNLLPQHFWGLVCHILCLSGLPSTVLVSCQWSRGRVTVTWAMSWILHRW